MESSVTDTYFYGYFRRGSNTTASFQDFIDNGEGGYDGSDYYLYGFSSHDKFGNATEKTKLTKWYSRKMQDNTTGSYYYDGIVYVPVEEDMLSRAGMNSNIISLFSMLSYVFDQDLEGKDLLTTGEYTDALMYSVTNETASAPSNWKLCYFEKKAEDEDDEENYYVYVSYDGEEPTDEEAKAFLETGSESGSYSGGTISLVSEEDVQSYAEDNGIELTINEKANNASKKKRITYYLTELYSRSHQVNISFNTISYDEIQAKESLQQTVYDSSIDGDGLDLTSPEIFKLHKSEFVGGLGSETKIHSPSDDEELNACDEDGTVINDYLCHKGIIAMMQEEEAYVEEYETNHVGRIPVNDLETLAQMNVECSSEHHHKAMITYNYTYTVTFARREEDGTVSTMDYSSASSVEVEDGTTPTFSPAVVPPMDYYIAAGPTVTSVSAPYVSQEEYWECDEDDYTGELHLYQHCGGHFYIGVEVFTSQLNSSNDRDLFHVDDGYSEYSIDGKTLAQTYGDNWYGVTDGTGTWEGTPGLQDIVINIAGNDVVDAYDLEDSGAVPSYSINYNYVTKLFANLENYKLMVPYYTDDDRVELGEPLDENEIQDYVNSAMRDGGLLRGDLVTIALRAVGNIGYYYGGSSDAVITGTYPTGLDCSGFVSWVYMQFDHDFLEDELTTTGRSKWLGDSTLGTSFGRLSTEALASDSNFVTITSSELKPGDILLKTTGTANGYTSSNHSAIYLGEFEGKYYFIQEGGTKENVNLASFDTLRQLVNYFDTLRTCPALDEMQEMYDEYYENE